MHHQLELVRQFHEKFRVPVLDKPSPAPDDRVRFRYELMKSEVEEYLQGAQSRDIENIAKELADMLYTVYGTILEHGLQNVMEEVFEEVHRSNMSKEYHQYKMIKGPGYFKADLKRFFEEPTPLLQQALHSAHADRSRGKSVGPFSSARDMMKSLRS